MLKAVKNYADQELIQMLKEDRISNTAIQYLYRNYFKGLSVYVQQNQGSMQDAEDLFQEVVVQFIELVKMGKFRGESSIKTFIYTLNRYSWLNELKRRGRALIRDEKYDNSTEKVERDVSIFITERESKSQIMVMIDRLGDVCKKILLAYYYEGFSMKEILPLVEFQNEQVLRNKKYKCLKSLEMMLTANPELAQRFKNALVYE